MQQSTPPMMPGIPSFPSANITTEQIQKCLDENKKLILAILDNQNLGKLAECAQYQAQLQKNLMYLAAIADAQPQMATVPPQPPQMSPHPAMQQGAYYMQQQTGPMAPQPGIFPPRMPTQFPAMHEHQQSIPGQMNFRPTGPSNNAGGGPPTPGNKQDGPDSVGDHGHGSSGEGEPTSYMKGSEEGK